MSEINTPKCIDHPDAELMQENLKSELVCSICGSVVSECLPDETPEWRSGNVDRFEAWAPNSRVGPAENHFADGCEYRGNVFEEGSTKGKKSKVQGKGTCKDEALYRGCSEVSRIKEALNLPKDVTERAKSILKQVYHASGTASKVVSDVRSVAALATACAYAACNEEGLPWTYREVFDAGRGKKRDVTASYKLILKHSDFRSKPASFRAYASRYCRDLKLGRAVEDVAVAIADNAIKMELATGRSPATVTSAAIYIAGLASGHNLKREVVASAAGLAESTIRLCYKELLENVEKLFPKDFKFVVPLDELPMC